MSAAEPSEMVQRVARAMRLPMGRLGVHPSMSQRLEMAKLAIEAMRDATGPMIRKGSAAIEDTDLDDVNENDVRWRGQPWGPCAEAAWQAMIDTALIPRHLDKGEG